MTTELLLTSDGNCWTGASSRALYAAQESAGPAVVLTAMTDLSLLRRYGDAGVETIECKSSGMFGALNVSRVLRHLPGESFMLKVYSPHVLPAVEAALKLVGRPEPITLVARPGEPAVPSVTVEPARSDAAPLLMWLGNINGQCGLGNLIERLGDLRERPWRLRVVGEGKARAVTPLLNRCKALNIYPRIEWTGYSADPFSMMNGVSLGVVTQPGSIVEREFAAASIPVITDVKKLEL